MKEGWQIKKLGEVCEVFGDGNWIESKDQSPTGIRLIQTGNVGEGIFKDRAEKARYVSEDTFKRLRCTEIFKNDCLISRLPDPVGRSCILPEIGERMITAVDCTIVRFKENEVLPWFFNYYSQSNDYLQDVERECTGTTRKRISRSRLAQVHIPLPPLPEQKRIVAKLDGAFEDIATAKANAERNLKNARAIFESELNAIFTKKGEGWEEKPLEVDTRFIDYRGKTPIKTTEGLRLITARNVRMGFLQREPEEFVSPDTYDDWMTRGIPNIGDVLFTTEAPLGFVCQLDTVEKVVFAQRIITLQTNRMVLDPTFLKWALISDVVQARIHANGTGATAQGIKASLLKKVMIPRAPYSEQKVVVGKCNELSKETQSLESIYQRKLTELDALKKSLLHHAFTGQL